MGTRRARILACPDWSRRVPLIVLFCHSERSRTLSEAEGDGGVEEPAVSLRRPTPAWRQTETARLQQCRRSLKTRRASAPEALPRFPLGMRTI